MKFYSRIAAVTLSAVMLLGTATQASAAYQSNGTYYDTKPGEHWSIRYADHLYQEEVMSQQEHQNYDPNKAVTAEEAVSLLTRVQNEVNDINGEPAVKLSFQSVAPDGIQPDDTIDRGDLVLLVDAIVDEDSLYLTCRKTPGFIHGDIRHTLFSRSNCTDSSVVVQ